MPILNAITPRGQVSHASLFTDMDVDIPLESRKKADVMLTLPDDAGPKGEASALAFPHRIHRQISARSCPALCVRLLCGHSRGALSCSAGTART